MKKFLSYILLCALFISLSACSNEPSMTRREQKIFSEIHDTYNMYSDDIEGLIHELVFFDGKHYYRVTDNTIDKLKSSSNSIGNPASYNQYGDYQLFFYEDLSNEGSADRAFRKSVIKIVYDQFVTYLSTYGSNYFPNDISSYIYRSNSEYYDSDGRRVSAELYDNGYFSYTYENHTWQVCTFHNDLSIE